MSISAMVSGRARRERGLSSLASRIGVLVVLAALAVGVGIAGASLETVGARASLVAGVVLVIAVSAPTFMRLRRNPVDGPGVYGVVTAIELGLISLTWLGNPPVPGPGLTRADIGQALIVVAIGIAAFGVGARLAGPVQRIRPLVFSSGARPSRGALVIAFAVATLGALGGAAQSSFGYVGNAGPSSVGQLFSFLDVMGAMIVLLTALIYFHDRDPRLRLPLIAFTIIQLALGFLSGVKTDAIQPLVFIILAYIVCRGRVPWRAILLVVAFTLIVVVPLATTYRQSVRQSSETAAQALSSAFSTQGGGLGHTISSAYDYVIGRFRNIDSVALIVGQTPSVFPYAGTSPYLDLPAIIVVPRFIWPGKPQLDAGVVNTHTYWQAPLIASATPVTNGGDLYWHFGLSGVVIGLLAWGLVIGYWQRLRERLHSPRMDLVFLYSLLAFISVVETDLPEDIATASKTLPLVAVLGWLLLPGRNGSNPGYQRLLEVRGGRRNRPAPDAVEASRA